MVLWHWRVLMAVEALYTADQVAVAARELREAAGAEQELFTGEQVIAMLSEEILLLRERGFTDERIAGLFSGFDIEVTPEQIARHAEPAL
jgi:hypothetical protein